MKEEELELKLTEGLEGIDLNKYFKNWKAIEDSTKAFPQYAGAYLDFVLQNADKFLTCRADVEKAKKVFSKSEQQKTLLENCDKFVRNWNDIKAAVINSSQPEQKEMLLKYVFKNADKFLNNRFNIRIAIETFPGSVEAFREFVFKSPKDFFPWINGPFQNYRLNISSFFENHLEVSKNARMISQMSRALFKRLPVDVMTEILKFTSEQKLQTEEELREIAKSNSSKPSVEKLVKNDKENASQSLVRKLR